MSECAGVEQDHASAVVAALLDAVDQLVLGIGLEAGQLVSVRLGPFGHLAIDIGQPPAAVDFRLPRAQQIEIGSMQDQNLRHESTRLASGASGTERSVRVVVNVV